MPDYPPFMRGPLPGNAVPLHKPSSAGDSTPPAEEPLPVPVEPEPTRWAETHGNRRLVINPSRCEICGQTPHRPTKHHEFEPAVESEAQARLLGWPMPTNQEPLL